MRQGCRRGTRTGEIKCRKHRRDYTPWRGSTCTLRFTLLTSLIILSILCGVGGCNLAPGREWEGLPRVTQAANIFIKNLERASSPVRALRTYSKSAALFLYFYRANYSLLLTAPLAEPSHGIPILSSRTYFPSR